VAEPEGDARDPEVAHHCLGHRDRVARELLARLGAAVAVLEAPFEAFEPALALQVSRVRFRELVADEIVRYVASGESQGKAGAYAIQSQAAAWVSHLEGSYSGVMGLPLYETAELLRPLGWRF